MLSDFLPLFTISPGSIRIRSVMLDRSLGDTIIAVSTPPGYGGMGILRLSGKKSRQISRKIFRPANPGIKIIPRLATFGNLIDPESGEPLDEGYLIFFPGRIPTQEKISSKSVFTGARPFLKKAFVKACKAGARFARPGEFTLRAFLHGRIDIIQAEAVNDLIRSSSMKAAKLLLAMSTGKLLEKNFPVAEASGRTPGRYRALIEFPDDKICRYLPKNLSLARAMALNLNSLISSYSAGKAPSSTESPWLSPAGRTSENRLCSTRSSRMNGLSSRPLPEQPGIF